jgi:maltose/moltooligosaccharide transporter
MAVLNNDGKKRSGLWSSNDFQVGSLRYTRAALLTVMFWMLWSDLCLQIMEQLPSIIPLQLKWLGASDKLIGFVKDSLLAILTVAFVPIVGMQSDRHRSAMGRRRPFLLWNTIPVCLFLALLGFADPIAHGLHDALRGTIPGLAFQTVGIAMIALFAAGFYVFNLYVFQIYNYLVVDVIPREVMGTFVGLFRAIGAIAGFVFNRWIFGFAETQVHWVYVGCALLYAVAFFVLVWRVREGEYPPLDDAGERKDVIHFIVRYARECYGYSFYIKLFSISLFYWAAWVPFMTFIIFFATSTKGEGYAPTLGLTADAFGKIKGWTFLPKVLIFISFGPLVDRFHSLRILLLGLVLVTLTYLAGFFVVHSPTQFLVWWVCNEIAQAIFQLAYMAMNPALLPRSKFGQYASAAQLYFNVGMIASPVLCGWLMDEIRDYRYLFLWSGINAAIATGFAVAVYRHWLRLGGDQNFVTPADAEAQRAVAAKSLVQT